MATLSSESPLQSHRWRLVGLLALSVFINYVDRGNLSVAAPVLGRELSVSPTQLGLLFSAFFWTYALCQIPAGWLVDRFNVNRVYAAAYLIWSVATLLTAFAHTLTALLIVRLLLGLGESVVYPACSQILVRNFSEQERGRANSLIDVGAKAGPALGTLLGGLIVASCGWRALFLAAGVIGLLWLGPWYLWAESGERGPRETTEPGPTLLQILAPARYAGHFARPFLLRLCLVFSPFLATLLFGNGAALQYPRHGAVWRPPFCRERAFCSGFRLDFGPSYRAWGDRHTRAQGFCCFRIVALYLCVASGDGSRSIGCHGPADRSLPCHRPVQFQCVGHYADARRSDGRRKMVGNAECCGQSGRSCLASPDRARRVPNHSFLSGVCVSSGDVVDRSRRLFVFGGRNRAAEVAEAGRKYDDNRLKDTMQIGTGEFQHIGPSSQTFWAYNLAIDLAAAKRAAPKAGASAPKVDTIS